MGNSEKREQLRKEGFDLIDTNLSFLLGCLEDVLKELGQDELIPFLPWHGETIPSTDAPPEGIQQLYSISFQLLNMVEERVAVTIRRERETEIGPESIRGLWAAKLNELKELGITEDQLLELIPEVSVEPVLTAHPTEAKRATVRERHRAIYKLMVSRENAKFTSREQEALRQKIKVALATLWCTGEIHLRRPELSQELRNALYYLRERFPSVIDRLDRNLEFAWENAGFDVNRLRANGEGPKLRFATWIGGDRDGHALVTSEVTRNTLLELRHHAFILLRKELSALTEPLTMSKVFGEVPSTLTDRVEAMAAEFGESSWAADVLHKNREEPYRQLIYLMRGKLYNNLNGGSRAYAAAEDLDRDLQLIEDCLRESGAEMVADEFLRPLRHKVSIFGFHLASIDVRQNSDFHDRAVSQLLVDAGIDDGANFAHWSEEKRLEFLNRELASPRPFLPAGERSGDEANAVLDVYRVLADHIEAHGQDGLGSLIVSMTRSVSDLLCVYLLAREAGLLERSEDGFYCPLPVVPLFETMDDLDASPELLSGFLEHPVTQRGIKQQTGPKSKPVQQVMLGYSDSNKDCGILAAGLALYRAQRNMTAVGEKYGVNLNFFHGRGGTISRGAGPTHWFVEALPHGSLAGPFRMTEQGETIAQKYANRSSASYNLELLLACLTAGAAKHRYTEVEEDPCLPLVDTLARSSEAAYQALLRTDGFIPFYREVTPLDVLENSRIGSRPSRRSGKATQSLDDLRAIPWVFSWTQARFYLPGWYGVGSALSDLKENNPQGFEDLKKSAKESVFLRYVLTNVETNLAAANSDLMDLYADLVTDETLKERFMSLIKTEFKRTQELLDEVFEAKMDTRRPRMSKTLSIREEPLKALHLQQIKLIKQWRSLLNSKEESAAEELFPELLLSINAIASGLRTTG